MGLRLTTTAASFESVAWTPVNETSLIQFAAADPQAKVTLLGRVHALAPYRPVHRWEGGSSGFVRIVSLQSFKLAVGNNSSDSLVEAWDSE